MNLRIFSHQIFRTSGDPYVRICTDAPAQFSPSSEHRNSTPLLKQGASKVRLFPTFLQGKVPKATVSLMMPMVRAEVARSVAVPGTLSMIYRNR